MQELGSYIVTGLSVGFIYGLVALGFVLIYKASDALNLAQGELVLAGAYAGWALAAQVGLPFPIAVAGALVFAVFLGWLIERLALRPLIGEPVFSVIMVTIGLSSVLRGAVEVGWSVETRVFPPVFSQQPVLIAGLPVSEVYLWSLGLSAVLLAAFTVFFRFSRYGIAMRAAADDQQAALSMGISVKLVFGLAWVIAAVVSAIGGVLLGTINGINISLTAFGLKVLPVAILGGLDSIPGAIIGGLVIGVLENLSGGYLDPLLQQIGWGGGMKEVAPFIVLVLVLMVRPYGLFGKPIIERV